MSFLLLRFQRDLWILVPANAMATLAFPSFPHSFIWIMAIVDPWPGLGIRALARMPKPGSELLVFRIDYNFPRASPSPLLVCISVRHNIPVVSL